LFTAVGSSSTKAVVLAKLSRIEAQLHQQGRLLQSILAAVQTTGAEKSSQLPDGVLYTVTQLLELEQCIEDAGNYQKLVS